MKLLMLFIMSISLINMMILLFPAHYLNFHPLIYGMILFLFTLLTSLNLLIYSSNNWFSYMTFLILIGGLLIIFLHFTSFISNMKISLKWNMIKMIPIKNSLFLMFISLMLYKFNNQFIYYFNFNETLSLFYIMNYFMIDNKFMSFMFINYKNLNMIMCMIYLLICFTLIVKMCINKKFSLRKIN